MSLNRTWARSSSLRYRKMKRVRQGLVYYFLEILILLFLYTYSSMYFCILKSVLKVRRQSPTNTPHLTSLKGTGRLSPQVRIPIAKSQQSIMNIVYTTGAIQTGLTILRPNQSTVCAVSLQQMNKGNRCCCYQHIITASNQTWTFILKYSLTNHNFTHDSINVLQTLPK